MKRLLLILAWSQVLSLPLRAEVPTNPLRTVPTQPLAAPAVGSESRLAVLAADPHGDAAFPGGISPPELLPAPPADLSTDKYPGFDPAFDYHALDKAESFDHLVHPLLDEPWFSHSDPNDPQRHVGLGQPLVGTSWRNRPWFFGAFVGGIMMDDVVSGIYQNDTTLVGARLGYDFDHYWGLEGRWAFARPDLEDSSGAPLYPASRDNFGDLSMVVYPLGDACWRPYLSAFLGFTYFLFN
jgi:hypothetical protein